MRNDNIPFRPQPAEYATDTSDSTTGSTAGHTADFASLTTAIDDMKSQLTVMQTSQEEFAKTCLASITDLSEKLDTVQQLQTTIDEQKKELFINSAQNNLMSTRITDTDQLNTILQMMQLKVNSMNQG